MKHIKIWLVVLFAIVFSFSLVACGSTSSGDNSNSGGDGTHIEDGSGNQSGNGGNQDGSSENPGDSGEENPGEEKPDETPDESDGKVLIVYFSATGTTERVANTIHSQVESDIYEIVPQVPYTSADLNYSNSSCRANQEQNDPNARPAINGSVENIEDYDTIFLGYPIWWGQAPKIIYTFLESYDFGFEGVTIIPFCTSGGSAMGTSARNLHGLAPQANWKTGARITGTNVSSLISQMD